MKKRIQRKKEKKKEKEKLYKSFHNMKDFDFAIKFKGEFYLFHAYITGANIDTDDPYLVMNARYLNK